jgi:hypothetical protein
MSGEELGRAVDLLVRQAGHWTAGRWAVPAGGGTRGDLVHALVQRVADLDADAEGRPRRPVPRLVIDTGLPDQLRVVAADLIAAAPSAAVLAAAAGDVDSVRRSL